jgi:hypothetical protein
MLQIGVINNLRAGHSSKQVWRTLELLRAHPDVLHVETDQAGALPDAIADLARREIDLLVVNGGDGTLQHTLTEILGDDHFEKLPMLAPLRGGRTNTSALDLGAQRDPVKGLATLLRAAREGKLQERIVHRPVLRIDYDGGRRTEYGMFFGAGLIRRAISLVQDVLPRSRQGAMGAGLLTLGLVAKTAFNPTGGVLQPDKMQVLLDGSPVGAGEFRVAMSTTLERLFWRLRPFWGTGPAPVRATCISANAWKIGRVAPGILAGRPSARATPENGYTSRNVERAEFRLGCGFTIDGELYSQPSDDVATTTADRRITFVRA